MGANRANPYKSNQTKEITYPNQSNQIKQFDLIIHEIHYWQDQKMKCSEQVHRI